MLNGPLCHYLMLHGIYDLSTHHRMPDGQQWPYFPVCAPDICLSKFCLVKADVVVFILPVRPLTWIHDKDPL